MKTKLTLKLLLFCLLPSAFSLSALAQGTGFTYQGRLTSGTNAANGTYDLTFALFSVSNGAGQLGGTQTNSATGVTNGLFTVTLDFGNQFPGADRWLEIAVKTNGAALFTTLSPRQKITAAPYAIYAGGVTASGISGTIAPANIGAESITTGMLATGAVGANQLAAGAVTTAALADGAVTAPKLATVTNWYGLMLANPTPAVSDNFGWALAAVGSDRVLIGANADDTGATDAGAAYLFGSNGTLLTTFTNPFPANGDNFGVAVAAVGNDRVLIGAYAGATNVGAAYLFRTNGTLLTTFTNPTPAALDYFGYRVATVGSDRVLIGAYGDDTGALQAGAAYLFRTNGTLLTTFTNPTPTVWGVFGWAVAAVGSDRVLISAFGTPPDGAAHLFTTNGTLLTTFTNPTPTVDDNFGISVAALGSDRVLIGAQRDDTGAFDAGAAYLFRTNGTLLATFTNPTPASSDWFGWSVAAVGSDRVLIGMRPDETGGTVAGAAYLFSTNGTLLETFTNPIPTGGGQFGNAVAAVGSDRVLIGARWDDTGASNAGAAHLFSVETYTPGLVADGVRHGAITTASLADGAVTAAKIGGVLLASQIPDLNASKITSGTLPAAALSNAWKTGGNAGATPGANFIGTTDPQALELKVNGTRALRLEPNTSGAPNVIGGSPHNFAAAGVVGAAIGGGGATNYAGFSHTNKVTGNFGAVGGGYGNTSGDVFATVGGGVDNTSSGNGATVGGGAGNLSDGSATTVGGGAGNIASFFRSTVGGGEGNNSSGNSATVPGGYLNSAGGAFSFAAGNRARANHDGAFVWADSTGTGFASTGSDQFLIRAAGGVGIGTNNPQSALHVNGTVTATGFSGNPGATLTLGTTDTNALEFKVNGIRALRLEPTVEHADHSGTANVLAGSPANFVGAGVYGATIAGGGAVKYFGFPYPNEVTAHFGTVGGGDRNVASGFEATVSGGSANTSSAQGSTVGGGSANISSRLRATVGGGEQNTSSGLFTTVGGGQQNTSGDTGATVGGGVHNTSSGGWATVGGGGDNSASGIYATIPGGQANSATNYAFAAGCRAKANHTGAFVWADSTYADFASTANDQFSIRASGGVRFASGTSGRDTMTILDSGFVGINTWPGVPDAFLTVNGSASKPGGGPWSVSSDERLKKNIRPLAGVLEKLLALRGVSYEYKEPEKIHELSGERTGLIAQEVEQVFPDWVETGVSGYKRLTVRGFEALTVEALRELRAEKDAQISALERRLEDLERLINRENGGAR